jgi:hypothetical protein
MNFPEIDEETIISNAIYDSIDDNDEDSNDNNEDEAIEYENSLKRSMYYQYYDNYTSPDGRIYKKDNATVPYDLLIKYINHMGYTKFTSYNFEFKYYSRYATIKKYDSKKKYSISDDKEIEAKLLKMINKEGCICYRPSFIYTAGFLIGNDCSFSGNLKDKEYSGIGSREISYYNGAFSPEE